MDSFPPEVRERLGWYVYRLIDPRNGETFYIGKGKGDRVFEHARGQMPDETSEDALSQKLSVIRDIHRQGLKVLHIIHRHGIEDQPTAFEVEAALIDAYPNATNLARGHGSGERGCMHAEQIVRKYKAEPLEVDEPAILIHIGRTLDADVDMYEAVRGIWVMSRAKAEQHRLVLAYDGSGLVVGAFRPTQWVAADPEHFSYLTVPNPKRIGFIGEKALDVWDRYVGRRVPPRPKGAANPIRYVRPGGYETEA